MPSEQLHQQDRDQLNNYNVAQLQFALNSHPKCDQDTLGYLQDISPSASPAIVLPETDIDYQSRRMSSSANSTADTDSSIVSRGEKRPITPSDSPLPKKARANNWEDEAKLDVKVQLPSISTSFDRRASLPAGHSESRVRHSPYPPTALRHQAYAAPLNSYTFPPVSEENDSRGSARPRLTADVNYGAGNLSSNSYDSPYPQSGISNGLSPYSESDGWSNPPSGIVRPNSTPGQISSPSLKYEDGLRHASFSGPVSQQQQQQQQMFGGSARISGQHERRPVQNIKNESWQFPNTNDFVLPPNNSQYSPPMAPAPPAISVSNSPNRSPQGIQSSTLVDRPQRKRGKLPKETTDYLKSWLHRHSDHPYPSEEEKKQLCHATGLSMSQVSNWMINARRRILAPAHRAASGPTTTAPFPPSGRSASLSGLLESSRRSSMPQESLQLYHPMTLQSMPNTPNGHHNSDYRMLGMNPRSGHHMNANGGHMDFNGHNRQMLYVPNSNHSNGHGHSSYLGDVPLSAPPTLSGNPFTHGSHGSSGYLHTSSSPRLPSQGPGYFSDGHGSAPGSGYATPQ